MGFGGGAFGTGSYIYSTIDNKTIKLNLNEGVIYASSNANVLVDNTTIVVNPNNELAVRTAGIVDNATTSSNSSNQIYILASGLVDNSTTIANSSNKIVVNPSGFVAQLVDNSTTKVNTSNQIEVVPAGIVSSLVDNITTGVNSNNQIFVKTSGIVDNSTIKVNSSGLLYAVSQAPAIDNNTIYLNSSNQLAVKPSSIIQSSTLQDVVISSNTTLTSDVYCNNFTINSGVVLTTNGYNIYCEGTFTNNGTINTGYYSGGGSGGPGTSQPNSYGGSGGGGGGNGYSAFSGYNGGNTLVPGGAGGSANGGPGGAGSTPSAPTLSNSLIQSWYKNGFQNYLSGAGGGGGVYSIPGGSGGAGIYIQANKIIAGTINANGQNGSSGTNSNLNYNSGGGGGGGGVILLAYGNGGYTAGTYNVSGGAGGNGNGGGNGGPGGNGQVLTYNYSIMPINIASFNYTLSSGILNRNSSYQYALSFTTNTSPTTIISQPLTPQYTGLVKIKAVAQVWNDTAGDGVFVGLYNGSTELDSETLISNTANQQQIAYLYNEVLYSAPFSQQAFSIQFNAVGGGTAYAEIQEFTIEEVY